MRLRSVPFLVLVLAAVAAAEESTAAWEKWSREQARELERRGSYEEAIEEWFAVSRLRPGDVRSLSRAAVLAVEADQVRGKELAPGTTLFSLADRCVKDAAPRWGQSDPGLGYVIGRLRFAEKKWETSWKMLRRAKETGFDPLLSRYWYYRAGVNRSVALIDNGRFSDAKESLTELRRSMPDHPDKKILEIDLAASHRGMQEPEEAMKLLRAVLDREPDIADAHYQWGLILAEQGRLEEAASRLREAMRFASAGSNRGTYRRALLQVGDVEIKRGRLDDAEAAAKQTLALDPDDPDALFLQARILRDRGDLDHAVPMLRRVVRLRPNSHETLVALKQVLYELGETGEAEEVGRKIDEFLKLREEKLNEK